VASLSTVAAVWPEYGLALRMLALRMKVTRFSIRSASIPPASDARVVESVMSALLDRVVGLRRCGSKVLATV
jgi:hypothetical protein